MKHSRNKFLAAASITILSAYILACSQFDNIPSGSILPGNWKVVGTDEKGLEYREDLLITGKTTDGVHNAYQFTWQNNKEMYKGTGVYLGKHLGVSYMKEGSGDGCGAIFYSIYEPDKLSARSAVLNADNWGSESATRINGEGFEGEFSIYGTDPQLANYSGKLTIRKEDKAYDLTWFVGDKEAKGIGFLEGNVLAVVFGGENCRIAFYKSDLGFFDESKDISFTGKTGDKNGLTGTETIKKLSDAKTGSGNSAAPQ